LVQVLVRSQMTAPTKTTPNLYRTSEVARTLGVCAATVRSWADTGRLKYTRTAGGQRRYDVHDFISRDSEHIAPVGTIHNLKRPKQNPEEKTRTGAIYCRVSSRKQQDDLQRQITSMQQAYPGYEIYQDICSGLKYKRKGLTRLLVDLEKGHIKEVVVAHKDRLARFGVDLIEWFITKAGAHLVIQDHSILAPNEELTSDLMAIVHVFSCRLNGKRRYKRPITQAASSSGTALQGSERSGQENHQGTARSSQGPPHSHQV